MMKKTAAPSPSRVPSDEVSVVIAGVSATGVASTGAATICVATVGVGAAGASATGAGAADVAVAGVGATGTATTGVTTAGVDAVGVGGAGAGVLVWTIEGEWHPASTVTVTKMIGMMLRIVERPNGQSWVFPTVPSITGL